MDLDSHALAPADPAQQTFEAGPEPDFLSELLDDAVRRGASHVHFERGGEETRVRLRIAGQLIEALRFPAWLDLRFEDRGIEASRLGERVVLHLPASPRHGDELAALGMSPALTRTVADVLARGSGLVLVAGPAESGRTTTLRALLRQLDDGARHLLSVESAEQFRAALRQDADAILVDRIGDRETAALTVRAVEAGHLVLAGVDASDSIGALLRMRVLRVEPFQLASTLGMVLAQRLVDRLCRDCRRPVQAHGSVSALLGFDPGTVVFTPGGCERCDGGFAGRTAVFEAIHADAPLRRLINDGCDGAIIARHVFLSAPNLGSAARALVRDGVTTPAEAVRVSRG